jgi:hypothetical protein
MARNITLTLGAGLGADLGPNFNLTANVGSVTPSTATKTELTAGKSVSVDDTATQVTVTSTGTCTNGITQTIPCAVTTTTTTTTEPPTTTTTTTAALTCNYYTIEGAPSIDVEWLECDGTPNSDTVTTAITICAQTDSPYQTGGAGNITELGACSSPTTTTSTTTAGINYISYPADRYVCDPPSCGAFDEATEIAFPDTFTPVINKWYSPPVPNGYAYQLTSTTPSAGPGLVMFETTFTTCGLACSV